MTEIQIDEKSHLKTINEQLKIYEKIFIKEADRRNESFKNFKQNINSQIIPIYISISGSVLKRGEEK